MRATPFLLCLAVLPAVPGSAETPRSVPTYDARTFYQTISYRGASFNGDESQLLISSDASGVFNVYAQPVAGGPARQLTESSDNARYAVTWFPHDERFLFASDEGGNELDHLYVRERDGKIRDLTPGARLKANFFGWDHDRTHFFVTTNERDPRFFDVYRYAADDYARERIWENPGELAPTAIARNGKWIVLTRQNGNADSDLLLVAVGSDAAPRLITPHEGKGMHNSLGFSPDSGQVLYSTDRHGEFRQAWAFDIATGAHRPLVKADWDVSYLGFSETGRYRVHGVNADARTAVTILDTQTGQEIRLADLPPGDLNGVRFSRSETRLAFYLSDDTSPANLYVCDLASGRARRLTTSLNKDLRQEDLVAGSVVRYPSFDGLQIPALLYRPWPASAENRVPALVWVHGGPGGQSRLGYRGMIQHLVNHGYAVLAVNNRGSSGYGKTFYHMDDRRHGDVDLKDCVHGRRYLEGLDWVDGGKVGIIGGSYGGYMVCAALAFEPEAFNVGVDIFGVTNWVRTLESIPPWWASFRSSLYEELGDPATDGERLRRISPLFHASGIRRPLLVIQGANDPRVLQVESDEMVAAVRKNGVPVEYVIFEDEGHGFENRENRITASESIVRFLDEYLKK